MSRTFLLLGILLSFGLYGQNKVSGIMTSEQDTYEWIILYELKGASQRYLLNADVVSGNFELIMPENSAPGMYRLTYDIQNSGFVDFIYNREDVTLSFDPKNTLQSVSFSKSDENINYRNYLNTVGAQQHVLDSLQYAFFRTRDSTAQKEIKVKYKEAFKIFKRTQEELETDLLGKMAHHFALAEKKYCSPEIIPSPQEYLNSVKQHYFDYLDLTDSILSNSTIISEKIIDYIFYLNTSDDRDVQQGLYVNSVQEIMDKLEGHDAVKRDIITILLYTFAQVENIQLLNHVIDNYYTELPEELKNEELMKEIGRLTKLAIGRTAPDFPIEVNGNQSTLSELTGKQHYILVFWGTTCSHCLEEIPQVFNYFKENHNVQIIAIALETEAAGFDQQIEAFPNGIHILGMGKWQNAIARDYDVNATPSYFVLNDKKQIIAKPEFFRDLKFYFEN